MTDGGLPKLISSHILQAHWQRIESGGVGRGTPDLNGCLDGQEVWIEAKHTLGWTVNMVPQQVAWLERRTRAGSRCLIAVRQNGLKRDSLWLLDPKAGRPLLMKVGLDGLEGMKPPLVLGLWEGGPSRWAWEEVQAVLFGQK